ncbi:amidohydrolase [Pseudoflavonifractor phocaeensis]|uniref:amidohydrolase n=1 Tax=Pseudoflavonifractor phocaeensis TaxID=1870988 RepID=UPI001F1856D8|nr:amidohydrolase [Pseudoflavonifractor phocaeensis]MCF2660770.1 amidohydrolase [Pseudoflavonifractor phocaeensis]
MLIVNGTVHTMEGLTIPNGYVAVSGDKITGTGPMEECPAHWEGERVDAQEGHILPGYIDAHSHLGMFGDALGFEGDDGNESTDPCTPHLRAIDAINPLDRCFSEARAAGVTTVLTGPGSANPISGQFAAIKTSGRWVDAMVVKAPVAMKLALGENPKWVYNERHETPVTRMATAAIIRENLYKALEYGEKLERAAEDEEEDKPDYDAKLEALLPVVRGELPVHIHAHRADDIATGVRIAKEFHLKCVIVHGTEAHLIPELLEQEGVPVITGPSLGDRSKPELANMTIESPAVLTMRGVKVAICTDHPEVPIQYLPLCAALAVKGGMTPEAALAAITINPARIAGIDDRVGSLAPGKDADIVITSGHPINLLSRVREVFIGGERVSRF